MLPLPKNLSTDLPKKSKIDEPKKQIPPYMHREGFIPRHLEDFGDGGSFPEILIAQYPLNMGRIEEKNNNTLAVQVDSQGDVRYDAIARQGHDKDRIIQTSLKQMLPVSIRENETFDRPDEEQVERTTEETQAALEAILNKKIKAAQPKSIKQNTDGSFVKYTPAYPSKETGIQSRVIKMVSMPVDPFEPPRFKHKKLPKGPPSPPPPVLHSPPRKVSVKEQQSWVIPPCISNWKNPQGYTIPLDKRLATDGRGLQDVTINKNFDKFAEALYLADKHAREEVETRANLQQKLLDKEKQAKEESLRMLAERARQERLNAQSDDSDVSEDREAILEREKIRRERQKERVKESKGKPRVKMGDRDISEKIALGARPAAKETLYDTRLFNKSEGVHSGFHDEDAYDVYDKPLFSQSAGDAIYRPQKSKTEYSEERVREMIETSRFTASKKFKGSEKSDRTGPVEFEKADPFGLDQFLDKAKRNEK